MSASAPALPPVAQTPPQLYCQLVAAGWDVPALRRVRDASLRAAIETRHLLRGSGKPFSCHLVGVASLVAEATDDADLTVAALLHALTQARVRTAGRSAPSALASAAVPTSGDGTAGDARVAALLRAYASAGDLLPGAPPCDPSDRDARDLRVLQLADQLEDGLDGGPWWHGAEDDVGTGAEADTARGGAADRVARLRALAAHFAQAPALGVPRLVVRYDATLAAWSGGRWPAALRSGWYSSHAPAAEVGP